MDKPHLSPSFATMLAEHNPIGMSLTPDDVTDWFDYVWPMYSTRGYRNHRRAIAMWWSLITEYDIERSRSRATRIRSEAENAQLDKLSESINRAPATPGDWASQL